MLKHHFKVFQAIKVDRDLHVPLHFNCNPLFLPPWYIQETDAKLRFRKSENFPSYIENLADNILYSLLDERENRRHYNQRYSSAKIYYALILWYTSFQS